MEEYRILVVEDEKTIAEAVCSGSVREGTGEEWRRFADAENTVYLRYHSEVPEAVAAVLPEVDACVPYLMTGGSDSRYFGRVCDQCIRFLPFTIDAEQLDSIHGINEYVSTDTLVPAVDFYRFMYQHV